MQCERDQCALPRSGFKPVRMQFDFWYSVNTPKDVRFQWENSQELCMLFLSYHPWSVEYDSVLYTHNLFPKHHTRVYVDPYSVGVR